MITRDDVQPLTPTHHVPLPSQLSSGESTIAKVHLKTVIFTASQ